MKINLPILILAFLAISSLNQPCEAFAGELLGLASSVTGLVQFIQELVGKLNDKSSPLDETLDTLREINTFVHIQLSDISKTLGDLPSIFDHVSKRNELQTLIDDIAIKFIIAGEMKNNIEANKTEDQDTYEKFRNNELDMKEKIIKINNMLLDGRTSSYLAKNFTEGLRLYENVCVTNMSHQQLIYSLLMQFKLVLSQYFATTNMIYDFLLPYKNDSKYFDNSRSNLRVAVHKLYNSAVRGFKKLITTASQELWRCDPPETVHNKNNPGGAYYELNAFSKYVFNEGVHGDSWTGRCLTKCPAITKVDDCGYNDVRSVCRSTRKCPNKLLGCNNLTEPPTSKFHVCLNTNKTAVKRYTTLVPHENYSKFSCSGGEETEIFDVPYFALHSAPKFCKFCQCICQEKTYYISTKRTETNLTSNKVVTGARLVVEEDTIYIQIQQGTLLPGGIISNSSIEWLGIEKDNNRRVPISWEGIKSIDLISFKFAKNSAVVGFQFQLSNNLSNRITLKPYACKFNFKKGKIGPCFDLVVKDSPTNELKLDDVDVPTKAMVSNTPISNDDQFVSFTITSMEKDGGQTTIPFIDTQEVVPRLPTLLSGGGLYLRGQKGYGGFLALKLYTYNLIEHVDEYIELPDDIPW